jgi:hypothetical protein
MSNVPCRTSNVFDQPTNWPDWVVWSVGQVSLTFDMGRLTFDILKLTGGCDRPSLCRAVAALSSSLGNEYRAVRTRG